MAKSIAIQRRQEYQEATKVREHFFEILSQGIAKPKQMDAKDSTVGKVKGLTDQAKRLLAGNAQDPEEANKALATFLDQILQAVTDTKPNLKRQTPSDTEAHRDEDDAPAANKFIPSVVVLQEKSDDDDEDLEDDENPL